LRDRDFTTIRCYVQIVDAFPSARLHRITLFCRRFLQRREVGEDPKYSKQRLRLPLVEEVGAAVRWTATPPIHQFRDKSTKTKTYFFAIPILTVFTMTVVPFTSPVTSAILPASWPSSAFAVASAFSVYTLPSAATSA
jgi:hypothetical protein